jgi:ribosomal protein L19
MIKLIKKAEEKKVQFNVGDKVEYVKSVNDGRSYELFIYEGIVVKVHKVNLDFQDKFGNIYRASKNEVKKK